MRRSKRFFILILTALMMLFVISSCVFSAAAEDVDLSGAGDDSSGKIYFDVNDVMWRDFSTITCYIYEHPENEPLFEWGSNKGNMTDEGDGIITVSDATCIQRWLAQMPSNDNIGKPIS